MDLRRGMARLRAALVACSSIFILLSLGNALAQTPTLPPSVQKGVSWLSTQVQSDGSIANESTSIATPLPAREETFLTLGVLATAPSALNAAIAASVGTNVEYTARRIIAARSQATSADINALLALQNADGGWGIAAGYQSNALDTAFVLLALQAINAAPSTAISNAVNYLAQAKFADGGFGVETQSSVYVTAQVLLAANAWSTRYATGTTTTSANSWLLAKRGANLQYTTVLDNALALRALATQTAQSTTLQPLVSALNTVQQADGSWADDPYQTALALNALWFVAQSPTSPSTGDVRGKVVDQASSAAIANATVQLVENSASTTSGTDGSFAFSGVNPGTYTLRVSALGYQTKTVSIQITAGQVLNLGSVALVQASLTTSVSGVVKDNYGRALANVVVALGTTSALTDANGAYQLTNLSPGAVTITASLTYYQSATANITLVAGTKYLFSPTLYSIYVPPPTTTSLQGTVVDAATSKAISGASVVLNGTNQTTDLAGKFNFNNLTAGAFTLTINASGYQTLAATGTMVAGTNDVGQIALTAQPQTSTLSGTVTDADTHAAIAGASISISGQGLTATTDATGHYAISGIAGTNLTLVASAAGYATQTLTTTLPQVGNATLDIQLTKPTASGISFTVVQMSKAGYLPYEMAALDVQVKNATANAASLIIDALVFDAQRNIVFEFKGNKGFGTADPQNLPLTVPANATLDVPMQRQLVRQAAGTYSVHARAIDPSGRVMAEGDTQFSVIADAIIAGGLIPDPPLAQIGTNQPIKLSADLTNVGNQDIPAGSLDLQVVLQNADTQSTTVAQTSVKTFASGASLNNARGLVSDAAGNLYTVTTSYYDNKLIKIDTSGAFSVVATLPQYVYLSGLALDPQGNFWIGSSNTVYRVTPQGAVNAISIASLYAISGIDITTNGDLLLTGTSSSGQALVRRTAQGQETVLVSNGLSGPVAMVKDDAGNYVVTNYNDNTLAKISSSTGAISVFTTGLNRPHGITRDAQGNFYVANGGDNTVAKVSPTGVISTYATGFHNPGDLKFDASGTLFVSNFDDNSIVKVLSNGTVQPFVQAVANGPQGMKYDASGNLWIANNDGTLRKKDTQDVASVVATTLSVPRGLDLDSSGNIFVANYGNGVVTKTAGTTTTTFASGLANPYGVALDSGANVYVTEAGANRVSYFNSAGSKLGTIESFLNSPGQIRVGKNGEIYVRNSDSILTVAGGLPYFLIKGFSANYIAPDPVNGGVVAATWTDVYRIAANGTKTRINTTSLPFYVYGVGVDSSGTILLLDYYSKAIKKIDNAGNVTAFATLPDYSQTLVTDLAGNITIRVNNGTFYSVSATGTSTPIPVTLSEYIYDINSSADGKVLAWTNYNRVYSIDPATGAATQVASNVGYAIPVTRDATGQIYAIDYYNQELRTYDPSGKLLSNLAGFISPRDMVWTGTDFRFVDAGSRLYSLPVGGYPTKLGLWSASSYLAWSGGQLYGTYGPTIYVWASASAQPWQNISGTYLSGGIAARADGALSVADNGASRVVTVSSTKSLLSDFAGLVQPYGLAFDAQGRLYVANYGGGTVARFDTTTKAPTTFVNAYYPTFLAFDNAGALYVSRSGGVDKIDSAGVETTVSNALGVYGLLVDGTQLLALDPYYSTLRKWDGQNWRVVATGLSQPQGVKVAANGDVYIANHGNGTIAKYSTGSLSAFASNLPNVNAVNVQPDGSLYAGGDWGLLYQIAPDGTATDMRVSRAVNGWSFLSLATGPATNTIYGLSSTYGQTNIVAVTVTQPTPAPAPGTVVYHTTVPMPALPAADGYVHLDLGSWLPPYGGDFRVNISRANVDGGATNFVHVGPAATGALAALKPELPPGDQTEPMCLSLTGADFTSISRVEVSQVRPVVNAGQPNGVAADKAGNIYSTTYDSLYKTNPQGVSTQIASGLALSFGLAADSKENLYAASRNWSTGHYDLLRFTSAGTKSVVTDLGVTQTNGVQVNSRDEVLVGSPGQLLKVDQLGKVSTVTMQGLPWPRGIAVDGKDNVYVQNEGNYVSFIHPDGGVSDIFTRGDGTIDPVFEGDGYPNIAADCADNFYIATSAWAKLGNNVQWGEEHTLAQVIPRTGQISLLFDALKINPYLGDIDYLAFDRFGSRILMWNHGYGGVWQVPVTCGAIGVQAHLVTQPGQTLTGLSVPTSAVVPLADGRTEYVWNLKDVTASGMKVCYDTTLKGLKLGETRQTLNSGFLSFQNSFSPTNVQTPLDVPSVHVNNLVQIAVSTDKADYPAKATAQVTTALTNTNPVIVDGTLAVSVYDANSVWVGGVTQQNVSIPANGALPVTAPYAIGTILPAQYTVKAVLSNNGLDLAKAQATFNVLPDSATASATSSVHTDKQVYNSNDPVQIRSRAQSLSTNLVLSNLTLMVKVYDASGTLQFTHGYSIAQLLPGALADFSITQKLVNAVPGIYTVKQDLTDSQGRVFNHVEATYAVGSTSDTGYGLTGTIAAAPKSVPLGQPVTLSANASNQGNGALTNLPLAITVVDTATGNALTQFNQTSTLAAGATVPFNATWTTQGKIGATYTAVLSATIGSGATAKTMTLATDSFLLIAPPVDADVTLKASKPPLAALALIDASTPPDASARISASLGAVGYTPVLVNTAQDFATGVRSGTYQLYLLLATQVAPDTTTLRLLREAVHRGEGVITANGVAGLPDALAQITGLTASSALPVINAQSLDILPAAPGGAAHLALSPSLASRIVVPTSAQIEAKLTGRLPSTPDQGALSDEVATLGRVDIGYYGTDPGTSGTHLALVSMGRIHNADGSDRYTVWRIRNSGDTARNVTLSSGSYALTFSSTSHTDTFIASPIVAGTASHQLGEGTQVIETQAALTAVFSDTRLVDVGNNPGAIALWANAVNLSDVLDWTGAQHELHGALHSNSDIRLAGAQNLIDGPVHYATTFSNSGNQNTFTFPPRQVGTQPLPTLLNLDDFKPGGPVAAAVGAQYFDRTADCAKGEWHLTAKDLPLTSGVYWVPCDLKINGNGAGGTVTLVSTGAIQIDGPNATFQPFYQGLQLATTQASADAIHLSGNSNQFGGLVFAPRGTVQVTGSSMLFSCSVIADQIRFAGAKTKIDARQCPYATVQRQAPAILWNGFGGGFAAYSAFDWQAAISQYEKTPGPMSQLFAGSLAHVAPTNIALRAGSIVPLTTTVTNKGGPFTGQLALTANDDSLFQSLSAIWSLDFTTQKVFTANNNLRLGTNSSSTLTATVSAATPVVVNPLKTASTTIAHLPGETVSDLIAAVNAIANRDAPLNAALTALQTAQTAITNKDGEAALKALLDAAEACGGSTNPQADALRTRIDWLIWAGLH